MSDEFDLRDNFSDDDNEPKYTPEEGYTEAQHRIARGKS